MMRGKRGLFMGAGVVLLLFASIIHAEGVTPAMAKQAADAYIDATRSEWSQLHHLSGESVSIRDVNRLNSADSGELLGYFVRLNPEGFIVLSGDTRLQTVIAYSYRGSIPDERYSEDKFLQMVRADLVLRNRVLRVGNVNQTDWSICLSAGLQFPATQYWPSLGSTGTGGWVETTWEQGAPYNNYCPIDPEASQRCDVGCVATAMAQIINYNSKRRDYFHNVTFDSGDSYESDRTSPSIMIDDDASVYDFPDFETLTGYMVELRTKYINNQFTDNNDYAALCFSCGIPVKMKYTASGSGTLTLWASGALKSKFGYKSRYIGGNNEEFYDVLSQNMKDSLLAILSMYNTSGAGHAVVCDGLQIRDNGDRLYHLNFGWGANSPDYINNAWYYVPDGIPQGFHIIDGAVVDIIPPEASYQPDNAISLNPDSGFIGDDVYNSTAEDQTLTHATDYGNTATYYIKVQNDGNIAGEITVSTKDEVPAGWEVYFYKDENDQDITGSVTSVSGWSAGELEPGEEKLVRMEVTPPSTPTTHKTCPIEIKSVSDSDDDFEDVAAINTSVGISEDSPTIPDRMFITHTSVNPDGKVVVYYGLQSTARCKLTVYDAGGRLVKTLEDGFITEGTHRIVWNCMDKAGRRVSAGTYFLILQTEAETAQAKTIVIR
ncbi:hypothetical protein GF359_06425 [candidate division WOR-3 bacterium]|uniref:T9SS type A sorting domain-containing protein n=1 Tax=candidate division WOR-3 bacterium TaxID=2052148 RepID=A0A9D5KAW1_UNCW3|nr:hypothetical protein [candidate division WOR-3 bacterium]MBD3364834.1 hypothetical protein [candidate division WOR-3 bacterium]